VSGPTKTRREPRRAAKPDRLPPERRVKEVMKILGEGVQRSKVEVVLDRMEKESEKWKGIRSIQSVDLKTFAKGYGRALDRVIELTQETPPDFAPLMLPYVAHPERKPIEYEVFDYERFLRDLSVLRWFCQFWEISKLSQKGQKAAADDKRVAALGALNLCEVHGIKPTKTKNGRFCRLAAALYGHPSANFLPHCQWVLKKREAWQKIADEVRESLAKIPAEVREAWPKAADEVRERLAKIPAEVREAFQKAADEVREGLAKSPAEVREAFQKAADEVRERLANPCRSNEA